MYLRRYVKGKVMLRKTMVALAIAFAVAASALPTSAFALSSAHGGGRTASGGYVYHSDRVGNLHRGLLHSHGRGCSSLTLAFSDAQLFFPHGTSGTNTLSEHNVTGSYRRSY